MNRGCGVRRSLILADLIDLAMHRFKHCSDLDDLWCLWEPGELIGGHGQVGAWSLVDVVAVNMEKLVVEVALEWPSLRVKLLLGPRKDNLICLALCAVDVPVLVSGMFLLSFVVPRGLSMLTLKIALPWNGAGRSSSIVISAMVSIKPWDSKFGFSSGMV